MKRVCSIRIISTEFQLCARSVIYLGMWQKHMLPTKILTFLAQFQLAGPQVTFFTFAVIVLLDKFIILHGENQLKWRPKAFLATFVGATWHANCRSTV